MSSREQEIAKIANMYARYLNGPLLIMPIPRKYKNMFCKIGAITAIK